MCREMCPDLGVQVLSHEAVLLAPSPQPRPRGVTRVDDGGTWHMEVV